MKVESNMKKYAIKNKSGFTLIETLLSLFIFSILSLIIISVIRMNISIAKHHNYTSDFYVFIDNLESNKLNFEVSDVSSNDLELISNHKKYNLSKYKSMLRFTNENNQGYLPMLDNVVSVQFSNYQNKMLIRVIFDNHQVCQAYLLNKGYK